VAEPRSKGDDDVPGLQAVAGGLAGANPLDLDRVIHERLRLGIVSALAASATLTFRDLRDLLGATDGNLSAHARKLEAAGYIRCEKSFVDRMPRTEYSLTRLGRERLERYLSHLEALISVTRAGRE
jgi:DNA-binding MarR family transcriptional regulator